MTSHPPLTERDRACIGPRDQKTLGSVVWCWQTLDLLKIRWERKTFTDQQFQEMIAELQGQEVWNKVPPEKPYGSLDALLEAEIGVTQGEARKQLRTEPQPREGRPNKLAKFASLTQGERAKLNGISHYTQKKLDYLAGHAPDLLIEIENRRMSPHAAYQQAKGIKPETPLGLMLRAWRNLTSDEQVRFVREMLTEQERHALADELSAIETRVT